jgi:hypothetical protein
LFNDESCSNSIPCFCSFGIVLLLFTGLYSP